MDYKKTEESKQDKTDIKKKVEDMKKNLNYDTYDKNFEEVIQGLNLGDKVSYVGYVEKEKVYKWRSGGFLTNNKKGLPYFVLRSSVPFGKKMLTFPVQYKNLSYIFVKKEIARKSKEELKKEITDEYESKLKLVQEKKQELDIKNKEKEKEIENLKEQIDKELSIKKEKKPRIRLKNFKIFVDGEEYASFQDKEARNRHMKTSKFKSLTKDKKVELVNQDLEGNIFKKD